MKIPIVLHGEIEIDQLVPDTSSARRYYRRADSPLEKRAWDAAVKDLAKQSKVYRPGRECLIKCEDLHGWIEAHPVQVSTVKLDPSADPIDFAEFKRTATRGTR
jgi:hypothetical protein